MTDDDQCAVAWDRIARALEILGDEWADDQVRKILTGTDR